MPSAKLLEVEIIKKSLTLSNNILISLMTNIFLAEPVSLLLHCCTKVKFHSADLHVLQFIDNN